MLFAPITRPQTKSTAVARKAVTEAVNVTNEGSYAEYSVRTTIDEGTRTIGVGFTNDFYDPDNMQDRNLIVDSIVINGPINAMPLKCSSASRSGVVRFMIPGASTSL